MSEKWLAEIERNRPCQIFFWPECSIKEAERIAEPYHTGTETIYVKVTTPKDQAELHRTLARKGYCPVLIDQDNEADYWRFHHPEGAQPK